ncbi:hypothetical protein ACED51_16965 [Photobacterium swingsii]|uniref:hypothetical protein n=1 Tax=Photobacterium swingsii TaxID=680026 RepID=UPI00352DA089
MNNEKRLWNTTELEQFGKHRSTIRKNLKAAGVGPVAFKGNTPLYDVVQVAPYLCKQPRKESDAPDLMGFPTAAELRAFIQAEREKLSLGKDAGELVTREDYENETARSIAAIKGFADKLITRVESAIPNASGEQLEALEQLMRFDLKAVSDELSQ